MHLDTSVVVSLLWDNSHTAMAEALMAQQGPAPFVSNHAGVGFAARRGRPARLSALAGPAAARLPPEVRRVLANPTALPLATAWIRRPDLTLPAPDAIHVAPAHRLGATPVTFDAGMAMAAHRPGVPVAAT